VLVVPGRLETRTGGYIYDRRIAEGLRAAGWTVEIRELDDSFPRPTPAALEHAAATFAAIPAGAIALVDGMALGVIPEIVEREAVRLAIVAIVHLPLAAEVGLDRDRQAVLEESERRALAGVSLAVVTGAATQALLTRHRLVPRSIVVVEPGTDPAPVARGSDGRPLHLLSVASVTPGKGHDVLLSALASVPHRDWHLTCAGSLTRAAATASRVRTRVQTLNLGGRVTLAGELDEAALAGLYGAADLFVIATLRETYCMAVAEALAHGLPVVGTATGAIPELVGESAGLVVPPGDTEALADALARVIGDSDFRLRLTAGARRVRDRLPTWSQASETLAAALASLEAHA
jgi:glycosyltransferase involved in cell wall biosynthesis